MLESTRVFKVRYYECDGYGHVNNTIYVRYLLEASLDAWTAAGFSPERQATLGGYWQSHRLDLEYLKPLRYGDSVQVRIRLAGFDGFASRLAAEFFSGPDGKRIARATLDARWNASSGDAPAAVPAELVCVLRASESAQTEGLLPGEVFPVAPPPPAGVYKLTRRVTWQDMDASGRVNDASYLVFTEECGMGVIAAYGWPIPRMSAAGFAIILRRHQVEYLQPAQGGEELEVATWASHIRRVMATRHFTITRVSDGALLLRAHTIGVWVDLASGRPTRIPGDFLQDFGPNLVL